MRRIMCIFPTIGALGELGILGFIGHFVYKATEKKESAAQWRWISDTSRAMWVRAAETMITASGIAAALVASLGLGSHVRTLSPALVSYVKFGAEFLVACVLASMALILALSRGHEAALARAMDEARQKGFTGEVVDGMLSYFALAVILLAALIALSCFFFGFLYLGRVIWHL